jgi:tetratricopeptide (TPR) repeat protein
LRLKVDFLVADPRKAKTREAIEALRNLMEIEQTALPEDTFLLARLYLADNNWPKFRQTILSLLTRNQYDARYLATYINGMLQHNEPLLEVERYLDRLEKSAGNQFVWFNLKADILIRQGKIDEALRLLNKFLGFPKEQVLPADPLERMRLVAMSLEQFAGRAAPRPNMEPSHFKEQAERSARFLQEAEKLYRAYVSQVATVRGRPRQEMALASFHARKARVKEALVPQRQDQKARQEEQNKVAQQCLQEALDVIQQSWSDVAPGDLAQTVALIMHDPRVAAEQLKQAERIVGEAQKKQYPPQVDRFPLLVAVADLFTVQERYEEAEAAYRQIVAEQPNNAIALNNLAVLLALRGKDLNEALDLINRAIAIRGPDPSMLDSLTSVYLARDENDKALAAIQEAIADTPTPVRLFHLARAYYQLDRKAEAAEALRKAEKDGPIRNQLEPPERPVYDKLMTELNP